MNKKLLLLSLYVGSLVAAPQPESAPKTKPVSQSTAAPNVVPTTPQRYPLDEAVVIIYGPERRRVICRSELNRLSIDGRRRTLDDLILEELLYQDAVKFKIPIDEEVIDGYISTIQKQHNLSVDDIKEIFKSSGYTYQEGRDELRMMYGVNTMIEAKIKSRIFVPEKEVKKYYDEQPEYKQAKYHMQLAYVPFTQDQTKEAQRAALEQFAKAGTGMTKVSFAAPFWLKTDEIADDKQFIVTMKQGDIMLQEGATGFELYKLVSSKPQRLVSLEKRYRDITDRLRQPKFEEMFEAYKKDLLSGANVVYSDEKLKSKVTPDNNPHIPSQATKPS